MLYVESVDYNQKCEQWIECTGPKQTWRWYFYLSADDCVGVFMWLLKAKENDPLSKFLSHVNSLWIRDDFLVKHAQLKLFLITGWYVQHNNTFGS